MLRKPPTTIRSRNKASNPEARYNIIHSLSENYYSEIFPYGSKPVSEKTMLTLKDYETITTSKRNFYLVVNEIPHDKTGQTSKASTSERTIPSILSLEKSQTNNEVLDTVRSGESLIKHFNFDTSKYNGDTNKCIAFWRALMKTGIEPVKCTLIKAGTNWNRTEKKTVRHKKEKTEREEIKEEEDEEEIQSESDTQMWYRALVELQRRKMDEVAFAATSKQCKLCEQEEPYIEFKKRQGQRFSKNELRDTEDVTCLNNWNPVKLKKKSVDTSVESKSVQRAEVLVHSLPQQPKSSLKQQPEIIETSPLFSDLDSSPPEESMETNSHFSHSAEETDEQNATPKQCECRREICQCNQVWTRDSPEQNVTSKECECRSELCQCNKVWTRSPPTTNLVEENNEQNIAGNCSNTHLVEEKDAQYVTSEECECRREICQCNKIWTRSGPYSVEETYQQNATPKECECRREICQCNKVWTRNPTTADGMECTSTPMVSESISVTNPTLEKTVIPLALPINESKSANVVPKQSVKRCTCGEKDCECDKTTDDDTEKWVLPECDVCKDRCNCWNHKIKLSKRFIDDLRYEMHYKATRQDKSCEQIMIEEVKEPKRFCVICGHNDCHCNGSEQQARHKYFQHIQFDDDVITLLLEQKEKLAKRIGSRPLFETDSQSTSKQIYDEKVCCKPLLENIDSVYKPVTPTNKINGLKKKLLITPEQRVKQIVSKNTHIFEIDKYGIPQVVRYADGNLGPKRVTSDDILSSSMEDIKAAK